MDNANKQEHDRAARAAAASERAGAASERASERAAAREGAASARATRTAREGADRAARVAAEHERTEHTTAASDRTARTAHSAREGADRAKQFMPFATLRGYYDAVRQQEREETPRRELQDEDIERISATLAQLTRGDVVRITYYDADAYVTMQGAVSEVVPAFRWLSVVKTRIPFEDISRIEML